MKLRNVEIRPFRPYDLLTLIERPAHFESQFGMPAAYGLRELFVSGCLSADWLDVLRREIDADATRFGFAVIESHESLVSGAALFKGPPSADRVVEIAYAIASSRQGRGLATVAATALIAYAVQTLDAATIRAHTQPEMNASTRVLQKCGFHFVGDAIDPEDGHVWRWERSRMR